MNGEIVELMDGTRIEVKVNFGTIYYLKKCGGEKLIKKIESKQKQKKKISDDEQMEISAKIIYALLRSNGKEVTFDEALSLMPPDTESMKKVIDTYNKQLEKIKKKETAKRKMKKFSQK